MLNRLRLGTKLTIAFALVVSVAIIIGAMAIRQMNVMKVQEDDIYKTNFIGNHGLSEVTIAVGDITRAERSLMVESMFLDKEQREGQMKSIETGWKKAEEGWAIYDPVKKEAEEKKIWEQCKSVWEEWKTQQERVMTVAAEKAALVDKGIPVNDPRVTEVDTRMTKEIMAARKLYKEANKLVDQLTEIAVKEAKTSDDQFDVDAAAARNLMLIVIGVGALIAASLAIYFVFNLNGIIRALVIESKKLADAAVNGQLGTRGDAEKINFEFRGIITGVNETLDSLVGHIDSMPAPALIVDNDLTIQYMNKTGAEIIGRPQQQIIGTKCYEHFKTSDCNTDRCACIRAIRDGRVFSSETDAHPGGKDLDISYTGVPVKDREGKIIGALEIVTDMTAVKQAARLSDKISAYQATEVNKLVEALGEMARGNLSFEIKVAEGDRDTDETRKAFDDINNNLKLCVGSLNGLLEETGGLIQAVKEQNLERRGDVAKFQGGYAELVGGVNTILDTMNDALVKVVEAVSQVTSASGQITAGSQTVAEGAAEQAGSLEEITSSLEEMASMTKQNAANAGQAQALAKEAFASTDRGNKEMERMNNAIEDIKQSADQTAKIIKTIDEIAFQTNLLALNAAVEAARAGEAGKGFAVVAEEVRNLAMRSADAAKNTAVMIEGSVKNADNGVKIVTDVAAILKEIGGSTEKVNNLVREIALASKEQALGIEQVNTAMGQLDKVTQANSSSAEESASAAEELSSQAMQLSEMVCAFTLAGFNGGASERPDGNSHSPLSRNSSRMNMNKPGNGGNGFKRTKILTGGSRREQPSEKMPSAMIPLEEDEDFREF